MHTPYLLFGLFICGFALPQVFLSCSASLSTEQSVIEPPHIVFVTGDEEYRSEESMPMLARILQRELGAKISLCYSLDSTGFIDPNRTENISGLEALTTADLMVLFTRFRNLPDSQRTYITDFAESGKPMVGFRTATHAFFYEDSSRIFWNDEWPSQVFGQQWITHHGHFEDGHDPLTAVSFAPDYGHPILQGLSRFDAYSWLYHVEGGGWNLQGNCTPLLYGRSLRSQHEMAGRLNEFPLDNPVAWTKTYTGTSGIPARVFFTTLGHPFDFNEMVMRRLAIQGIYWALGQEAQIPEAGLNVDIEGSYQPNNSGFGMKFKQGQLPANWD